jgi:hypothetical protein
MIFSLYHSILLLSVGCGVLSLNAFLSIEIKKSRSLSVLRFGLFLGIFSGDICTKYDEKLLDLHI